VARLGPVRSQSQRRYVLLIEGDADTGQSLTTLLRSMGHEVELAVDGESARKIARSACPDMIVLDLDTACCDGWSLAKEFRLQLGLQLAPIVVISGRASKEDRHRSFEAGCDYHLSKPLDLGYLENLIASC
jgi:DNA-binding response OmpR family regulator